jgi:hypothetical protein
MEWLAVDGVPAMSEVVRPALRSDYRVGDKIGVWPMLKETNGDEASVVVSTVCIVHNWFGKAYLFLIVPFHKLGVQLLLARALAARRM